jgi:hypothetical protein
MDVLRKGAWEIKRVLVNEAPVHPDEGYHQLIVTGDYLRIEPMGIVLKICQATPRSMMLESQSQLFWANVSQSENKVQLKLERQSFTEIITLEAEFNPIAV